ncbi:MAG TPA: response regulator [Candidatus Methylomirabilis sp.]|nr:response regulator [Candidatus Methylomirabilis sp.]
MARMLVVDDDPAWRALYRMGFESDFEVFEAVDGLDALAALERVKPDVIVLDLRMPHLDGLGFLRQLERRGIKLPVVVCSGTFMTESPPAIEGVFPAHKTPDLQGIWSALEAAMPRNADRESLAKSRRAAEVTVWRD